MNRHMRWVGILLVGISLLSLTGCYTWEGLGRDFESAGQGMQEMVE